MKIEFDQRVGSMRSAAVPGADVAHEPVRQAGSRQSGARLVTHGSIAGRMAWKPGMGVSLAG
jgi:hypothetical protein